jgi:hypothetical protein
MYSCSLRHFLHFPLESMTELGEAFLLGPIVPFRSAWDNLYFVPYLLMGLGGSVFISMIVISIIKSARVENNMMLVLSLCCTDWLFCTNSFIYKAIDIPHQGFATGYYGCIINVIFATVGPGCSSLLHIMSMSMERYLAIFHQIHFSNTQYRIWVISIWAISFLMVSYPVTTRTQDTGLELSPSMLVCTGRWSSRKTLPRVFAIIPLNIIFFSTAFNLFAYTRMILLYMKTVKSKVLHRTNAQVDTALLNQNERKMVLKAAVLTISFILCWVPYFLQILIAVITQEPVSPLFDAIGCLLCLLNAFLNPTLLYIYDGRIRNCFYEYWKFDITFFDFGSRKNLSAKTLSGNASSPVANGKGKFSETFQLKTTVFTPSVYLLHEKVNE